MSEFLRIGVVGLGMMGRNHVRVVESLDGAALTACFDPLGAPAGVGSAVLVASLDQLIQSVDAAIVAVPTEDHVAVGKQLIDEGIHVLVEKPLAQTAAEGQALVKAAGAAGVVLAVGHIERFNPAVRSLKARLAAGELGDVYQVSTERQGPFPDRIKDVGVIKDLASHDIDLTRFAAGQEYASISARVTHKAGRPNEDLVAAVGSLTDGTVVNHLVNWLTPTKERRVSVTGERGRFVADTLNADLYFYANASISSEWDRVAQFRGVSEGDVVRYAIPKPEPLRTELQAFCNAVLRGDGEIVTGEEGLEVLRVADAMLRSASDGTVEVLS